ncbi:MAG: LptF/LptG family permease [Candidatus Eisenbacteria bacterium]
MRVLDRYLFSETWRTVLIGLLAFITIFITLDMVENVDDFVDNNAGIPTILKYYAFQIPHIFTLTLPIAVLISCLFTVGQMARHYELIAIKASGIRFARTMLPLVAVGLVASALSLGVSEIIEPEANSTVRNIKAGEIKKSSRTRQPRVRTNISYRGASGVFYFAPEYDTKLNIMRDVVVEKSDRGKLVFRLNAEQATWQESTWVFSEAWIRWFAEDGEVEREAYVPEGPVSRLGDHPNDIVREQRKPEEMSYRELSDLVSRIDDSGGETTGYRVGLNMKISFPFTNLIVVLIGSPLSARLRRGGLAVGVGLGLSLTFVYYGFIRVGQTLGDQAVLPPVLASWLGNIFFGICGIILISRAERH